MDQFIHRERLQTFRKICKSYKPTIPLEFLANRLGFTRTDSTLVETKQKFRKAKIFLRNLGISADEFGNVETKTSLLVIDMAVSEQILKGIDIKGQIH
jgi:hypothetical protein